MKLGSSLVLCCTAQCIIHAYASTGMSVDLRMCKDTFITFSKCSSFFFFLISLMPVGTHHQPHNPWMIRVAPFIPFSSPSPPKKAYVALDPFFPFSSRGNFYLYYPWWILYGNAVNDLITHSTIIPPPLWLIKMDPFLAKWESIISSPSGCLIWWEMHFSPLILTGSGSILSLTVWKMVFQVDIRFLCIPILDWFLLLSYGPGFHSSIR